MRAIRNFVVVFALAHAARAYACSCAGWSDEVAAAAEFGDVFVGDVLSVRPMGRSGCGDPESTPFEIEIRVTESFKGAADAGDVVLLTTPTDSASCGVDFARGETRLVYSNDGEVLLCNPGGLAADHADTIQGLRDAS